MKTVLFLAALVALAVAGTVPSTYEVELKPVTAEFAERQKKIFNLLETIRQYRKDADYFKIGYEYNVEANIKNYTKKEAVEEFLIYYRSGFMPKHKTFSVFYDRMRDEAIALFKLFYYAKDFETFYKTAAYARVHFNDGQFLYAFYSAVYQREDTQQLVLPAPYEMFPQYFVNTETLLKAYRTKMQHGISDVNYVAQYGITHEKDYYVFYSNYSSPWFTGSEEQKLAYFTEDIGMNSFYYFIQSLYPFWFNEGVFDGIKELRGDLLYFNYQQLIAQYYLHRLSNGLGEIPEFSWDKPIKTGYFCQLSTYYPFFQRNDYYEINKAENKEYLQFVKSYERTFQDFLEQGHFKVFNQEIDLHNSKAINFVSNYFFTNIDLYEKSVPRNYERYYEIMGLHLLAGTPEPVDNYTVVPSALELYQTSLRDPMFYQFYARILNFIVQYKEYLEPYNYNQLHFEGVKINDVKVDKLVTFFDFFDFDISNDVFYSVDELKADTQIGFKVRQPRLNHKLFSLKIDLTCDFTRNATLKTFLGPQKPLYGTLSSSTYYNPMNFVELDWFVQQLTPGQNKIERFSSEFSLFKKDSVPVSTVYKMLESGQVPLDMSEAFYKKPNRMMLPKGTKDGFPFQLYVVVYPHTPLPKDLEAYSKHIPDTKPMAYPFDRPVLETFFKQPNIHRQDVFVYHEGEEYPNDFNVKGYYNYKNEVPKH